MRQVRVVAIGYALLVISAALGLAWLALALDRWLADVMGSAAAGFIVAFLFLAPLAAFGWHILVSERARSRAPPSPRQALVIGARQLMAHRPLVALGATVAAGLLIARFPNTASLLARALQSPEA